MRHYESAQIEFLQVLTCVKFIFEAKNLGISASMVWKEGFSQLLLVLSLNADIAVTVVGAYFFFFLLLSNIKQCKVTHLLVCGNSVGNKSAKR